MADPRKPSGKELGPGTPWAFQLRIQVEPEDLDEMGHVNNVVYLRYAQEAAAAHWNEAVSPELRQGTAWVVRRHEVDYFRPVFRGDSLIARTWIEGSSGATLERVVEIIRGEEGERVALARTVWVFLDPATMRPRRLPGWISDCLGQKGRPD